MAGPRRGSPRGNVGGILEEVRRQAGRANRERHGALAEELGSG